MMMATTTTTVSVISHLRRKGESPFTESCSGKQAQERTDMTLRISGDRRKTCGLYVDSRTKNSSVRNDRQTSTTVDERRQKIAIESEYLVVSMAFSEQSFKAKLADLSSSQQSIQTLSLWLIHHRKHVQSYSSIWFNELKKGMHFSKPCFFLLPILIVFYIFPSYKTAETDVHIPGQRCDTEWQEKRGCHVTGELLFCSPWSI